MNGKENAECSSASAQRASQTRESIKEEKDVRGIHLMLAEDNELNAEIVKALLEKRGITVDVAQDGRKALKMFKESWLRNVFVDSDGYDDARYGWTPCDAGDSRADTRGRRTIPIVAMTANALGEDAQKCHCGGYEYAFVQTEFESKNWMP